MAASPAMVGLARAARLARVATGAVLAEVTTVAGDGAVARRATAKLAAERAAAARAAAAWAQPTAAVPEAAEPETVALAMAVEKALVAEEVVGVAEWATATAP